MKNYWLAFLFMFLLLGLATFEAQADSPARVTFTSTAGSGEVTLAGEVNPLHTSFEIKHLIFRSAATSTATVSYVSNGVTNSIGNKVIAATDRALAITNTPLLFKDDKILVSNTDTNTYTIDVIWLER